MATDLIRYDLLVQDALRGVMRKVLVEAAANGRPPGDHHFTISFRTRTKGVRISKRLAEQWPQEMTIILQHQYSDLAVDERGFAVGLSFRSIPEQLYVPFEAVTGFFDPSVEFALKFELSSEGAAEEEGPVVAAPTETSSGPAPTALQAPAESAVAKGALIGAPAKTAKRERAGVPSSKEETAKIVSIDAFRKKK
ncbi:MAG: hypothetical protein HYS06_05915 [Methylocystis sp.]|nr:hypothetical protein [Methylocystis sp.]MBI3274452.1 hypothetical protein [Methylocystis sp.]